MDEKQDRTSNRPVTFDLPEEHAVALQTIAAGRRIRVTGEVKNGKFVVDAMAFANENFANPLFVSVNAPFTTTRAVMAGR